MTDPAIRVERLGKCYRIVRRSRYPTLRESIMTGLTNLFRPAEWQRDRPLWAIRDVSFEVPPGAVVGIIGRNGAGKSTILRILCRITDPTEGLAEIRGRVGSILEVGTGFHPELNGRENVYLNGAILGMRKTAIDRQFDRIVEFAEVEEFVETPVKHYSSGMYMRLAFAVAAHLDVQILLIDEVLAVGDAGFQRKCLGKMSQVAEAGRTVLFVSHNMQAVRQLCSRALWIRDGALHRDGAVVDVVDEYLQEAAPARSLEETQERIRRLPPDRAFKLESVSITQGGKPVASVVNGQALEIDIRFRVLERTRGLRVFFDLHDEEGALLFRSHHDEDADGIPTMEPGSYHSRATIPPDLLAPRSYELRVLASIFRDRACIPEPGIRVDFDVRPTGRANRAYVTDRIRGRLAPLIPWTTSRET